MFRALCMVVALLVLLAPGSAHAQGGIGVGSFVSPGVLSSHHADLDNSCLDCHSVSQGVDESLCMSCHDTVRNQVSTGLGFHADKGRRCESCHPEHRGRDFALVQLAKNAFDHSTTGFDLKGSHAKADCADCHTEPGKWTGLKSTCESCHDDPHGMADSKRDLLESCDLCHNPTEWRALPIPKFVFDHGTGAQTDYLLEGKHTEVFCADCHFDWRFVPVEHDKCRDCHEDPHRADFGKDTCEDCHGSPKGWEVPRFDHNRTPYRLEGLHKETDCYACHQGSATVPLAFARCDDCHTDVHQGQFRPRNCDECHSVEVAKFAMQDFDHDITSFPLVGLHAEVNCEQCHGETEQAVYAGRPFEDCDSCHEDEHAGRFEPTACQRCHTPEGFKALFFNHDDTAFPHTGKHKAVDCNGCHTDSRWTGFPFGSCADCHDEASPHEAGVLGPETCDSCHDTEAFDLIAFDHVGNTSFDLAPAHTERKCVDCHESVDRFAGMNGDCLSCHKSDRPWGHYDGDCGSCHEAAAWFPGGLGEQDHAVTGFRLRGQHARQECESCHMPERARGEANPQCVSCHRSEDAHRGQLGDTCEDCHSDINWYRVRWRHGTTGFPLRGAHKLAECIDCHASSYTGTPNDCFRCHSAEASQGPHHQTVAFRECNLCHREYGWTPPIYNGAGAGL